MHAVAWHDCAAPMCLTLTPSVGCAGHTGYHTMMACCIVLLGGNCCHDQHAQNHKQLYATQHTHYKSTKSNHSINARQIQGTAQLVTTVCAAEGTGVLSTQRSTCLMMVCRAALSASLSSGREYIRSRWWAPSGISTATTLSDTSSVTPKTDQGSRRPLLNTMLLVSLQQSSRTNMHSGQGTRFMHMTQRSTPAYVSWIQAEPSQKCCFN